MVRGALARCLSRRGATLVLILLTFTGCVSGSKLLGTVQLKDGTILEHVQIITEGQDGPKLAVVETYRYDEGKKASVKEGSYQAAGASLTAEILRGVGSAVILGGSIVGAGALIRPDRTTVNQSGGGATISNSGNASATGGGGGGGGSVTSCVASSGLGQGQGAGGIIGTPTTSNSC